jgi:glucose-1-phosphate adenylyltransferase
MGVYLFNYDVLSKSLWEDSQDPNSSRDFGKNVLPKLVAEGARVFSYPFNGYWIDVGTIDSYWQAHMDLVSENPPINLNDRSWIIHTRTEEQPPVKFGKNSSIYKSMITDGCVIGENVTIEKSILSPGVIVEEGAVIRQSIILTDTVIGAGTVVEKAILDKRVKTGKNSIIGKLNQEIITTIGKNSILPDNAILHPGAKVRTDITPQDFPSREVQTGQEILCTRLPYEI